MIRHSILVVLTFAGVTGLFAAEPKPKVIHLFDGKNLDGFHRLLERSFETKELWPADTDPNRVFTIENGLLKISGEDNGYLRTKDEYRNFRLVVEWKWGEKTWKPREDKARDAGIFVHCDPPAPGKLYPRSVEIQIIEGGTGDIILVEGATMQRELPGRRNRLDRYEKSPWQSVKGFRAEKELDRPHGEWNTLEIVCKDDTMTVRVNGVLANEGKNPNPGKGPILIQSEWAEHFYRRIDLYPL